MYKEDPCIKLLMSVDVSYKLDVNGIYGWAMCKGTVVLVHALVEYRGVGE
jgi:hypothetical protein